tara:strand:+ start:232 stop:1875 length:1644 start_codon:yes stop_codon:yes gene_type:complete
MFEIFKRLKGNPSLFTKILIASLFVNLLALATPIYVIQVLQRYVAYGVTSTLVTLVTGIIFVSIFEFFFRNIRHRITREFEPLNQILADKVMKKLTSIKTTYYILQKNFRPDVITGYVQTIQSNLSATNILILIDVPFVLIFLIALYLIHYQLGLIASILIFLPVVIVYFYRNKINELNSKNLNSSINHARLFDNASSRYDTVRYFNLINALKNAWSKLLENFLIIREDLEANKNVLTSFMSLSSTILTITIIAWGAILAVNGEISVGALIGANILGARAIAPVIRFIQTLEPLYKSTEAINGINQLLQIPQENESGASIQEFRGNILIKDLHFKYPQSKNPTFVELNCNVGPGELMVITGSNGSGKSTLVKVLGSILEFERGQIFYDQIEINQISLEWLRKNLTYLPQEPKFVDGTLLDNLIGLRNIKKDEMTKILSSVDLSDFVNADPSGINMILNNRGEDLPFGIRKRAALARALVVGGQVVLFDEPTESIDERGRDAIYKLIAELINREKTVIISSQDKEIINIADIKINLDKKPVPEITERK